MINVNMTSPEGVTLATGGKYCADNVKVTPTFEFAANAKRWTVTFASDVAADTKIVSADAWIAEHYADEGLVLVMIQRGAFVTASNIAFTVGTNNSDTSVMAQARRSVNDTTITSQVGVAMVSYGTNPAMGYFGTTSDGDVWLGGQSGRGYKAGEYTLIGFLR